MSDDYFTEHGAVPREYLIFNIQNRAFFKSKSGGMTKNAKKAQVYTASDYEVGMAMHNCKLVLIELYRKNNGM